MSEICAAVSVRKAGHAVIGLAVANHGAEQIAVDIVQH